MPRKSSGVRNHFALQRDKTNLCKYCGITTYKFHNATKMARHLSKCIQCPSYVRREFSKNCLSSGSPASEEDSSVARRSGNLNSKTGIFPEKKRYNKIVNMVEDSDESDCSSSDTITAVSRDTPRRQLELAMSPQAAVTPSTSDADNNRSLTSPDPDNGTSTPTSRPFSKSTTIKSNKSAHLDGFIDHISQKEQENLDKSLAKAIYVSGAPLSMVEHPLWLKFFEAIRPSYKVPSRFIIGNNLLNKEFENTKNEVDTKVAQAPNLHLQLDGWSNLRNEGIINFIINTPEPVFVKYLPTEDNRHTAIYISEQIKSVIEERDPERFLVLIGDNAANMQKSFELVCEKYPHLVPLGCVAHTLHLLCTDILDKTGSVKEFIEQATLVIKTINNSQVLKSMFTAINKEKKCPTSLKLPAKTRWGSHLLSLQSLANCKMSLQTLAVTTDETLLPRKIKLLLLDEEHFWIFVEKIINVLKPIVKWITYLEGNQKVIHKVHHAFKEIQNDLAVFLCVSLLSPEDIEAIKSKFRERRAKALKPIHFAASLLDPDSMGRGLSPEEEIDAAEFINSVATNMYPKDPTMSTRVMSEFAKFRTRTGTFWSKDFLWKCASNLEPLTWWRGFCSTSLLTPVATRILSAACTSAATERSFSNASFIHNKRRNRLTTERVGKITFISHNWSLLYRGCGETRGNVHENCHISEYEGEGQDTAGEDQEVIEIIFEEDEDEHERGDEDDKSETATEDELNFERESRENEVEIVSGLSDV